MLADEAQVSTQHRVIDPQTLRAARALLSRLDGKYVVVESLLFGSRARGDNSAESDADIALILRGAGGDRFEVLTELAALEFDVMLETGILAHALPIWEDEWRQPARSGNPALLANIRREGVRL